MPSNMATAYVLILPDTSRFRTRLNSQVTAAAASASSAAASAMSSGILATARRATAQMDSFGKSIYNVGTEMTRAGQGITYGFSLPVAAAGVAIYNTGRKFEYTMQQIVGLVGVSQQQVNQWGQQLLTLSSEIGRPANELASALYFATSSGIDLSKAMDVVVVSAKAATTGLGDTALIADTLTSAMNAYTKQGLTAANAADILVAAIREGKVEASAFAPVLGRLLPTASSLGISFSDVAGTLAVMSRTGLDAAEAATSLNQVMSAFLKPSVGAQKVLNQYGLSAEKIRNILAKPGGIVTAMQLLNDRTSDNDEALARIIPNIRAFRGVMNVLAQDQKSVIDVLDATRNSTGDLNTAVEAIAHTTEERYNKAIASIQSSMILLSRTVMPILADSLDNIANNIQEMAKTYNQLSPGMQRFILSLLETIVIAGPALLIIGRITVTVGVLIRAIAVLRVGIYALGVALNISGGWLTIIVVAIALFVSGLIYAYKHCTTFRNIINTVFTAIATAAKFVFNWFVNSAWPALKTFFINVGNVAVRFWRVFKVVWDSVFNATKFVVTWYATTVAKVITSVFNVIATVAMWLWHNVFNPVWTGIKLVVGIAVAYIKLQIGIITRVIQVLAPVVLWLWENIFKPVFQKIELWVRIVAKLVEINIGLMRIAFIVLGRIIEWLYQNAVIPVFNGIITISKTLWNILVYIFNSIGLLIKALGTIVIWLWKNVIVPAFNGIVSASKWFWNILRSVFNSIVSFIKTYLGPIFTWLWNMVIQPVFTWIASKISTVWNRNIKPVFLAFGNFIAKQVAPAFRSGVAAIARAWDGVKNVAKAPVKFIVLTVLNGGIIKGYNALARFFNVSTIKPIQLPRGFSTGGKAIGQGTETSDSIPSLLSKGEYVIRTRSAKNIGYTLLDYLNKYGKIPGYQAGGRIQAVRSWLPSVSRLPYVWGGVGPRSYDCSGLAGEVWARLTAHPSYKRYFTTTSNFPSFGFTPGGGTYTIGVSKTHMAGNLSGYGFEAKSPSAGIVTGYRAQKPSNFPRVYYLKSAGGQGNAIGGFGGHWYDFLTSPLLRAWNSIRGLTKLLSNKVLNSHAGKIVGEASRYLIRAAYSRIITLGKRWDQGNLSVPLSGTITSGANRAIAIAYGKSMAASRGWTGSYFTALLRLWEKESNWNYLAVNPRSGAYGIPQSLPGSKMAAAGADWRTNPVTQIKWGLAYITQRYRNPINAWAHSQAYNWYRYGGKVHNYDNGGYLPTGLSLAYNGTRRPERIIPNNGIASTTVINNYYNFPHYVGSRSELVRAIDELKRQRRI